MFQYVILYKQYFHRRPLADVGYPDKICLFSLSLPPPPSRAAVPYSPISILMFVGRIDSTSFDAGASRIVSFDPAAEKAAVDDGNAVI